MWSRYLRKLSNSTKKNYCDMKEYTQDWSGGFISNTGFLLESKLELCMEIGCFEGRVSNYIADNLLSEKGKLICVDPHGENYLQSDDLSEAVLSANEKEWSYFKNQYERFKNNVSYHLGNKIEHIRKTSDSAFPELINKYEGKFDLIYIDGDHRSQPVYIDSINSFKLCKTGGYILFDDYLWTVESGNSDDEPKKGIDMFLDEYRGKYEIVAMGYQVMIRKI